MLRSILVALDGSPSSLTAARHALDVARRHQARVEGLGIVNSAWIQRPETVPAGAMAFKTSLEREELTDANQRVSAVLQQFANMCAEAGVTAAVSHAEGDPLEVVGHAAASHDLIAVGNRSIFDVKGEMCELPLCVDQIIRADPRPVLLVPERQGEASQRSQRPILVAFDGSLASSRAVHMFALLGLASERIIHVLTINEDSREEAARTAGRACALLTLHGAAETHAIGLGDDEAGEPAEAILGAAATLDPELIVMGAYGRRGFQEIFGSCTRKVLDACPAPIFLYQ